MDKLDMGILRALGESGPNLAGDPRISLRTIGRKLGVDKDTVSRRLKRLQESGVVSGWAVVVNPSVLGAKMTRLLLDLPEHANKDDLVRKLKLVHGVTLITTLYGDAIVLVLYYHDEKSLRKTVELVSRISNAENVSRIDSSYPPSKIVLTETDWELVKTIQREPLKPFGKISEELGISARTAKRRFDGLFGGFALIAYPRFNPAALDATTVELIAFYDESREASGVSSKVLERYGDRMLMSDLSDKGRGFFVLFVSNAHEIHEMTAWIKSLPGVLGCRADIALDHFEPPDALSELVEKSLALAKVRA